MVRSTDPRVQQFGFAKLLGTANFPSPGYYIVKKYEIVLGRKSKSSNLDIVLGDNMNISRKHAKIVFNFAKGAFQLEVLGKNGVTVGGVLYTPSSDPLALKSKDLLQIGDTSFFFLLPSSSSQSGRPGVPAAAPGTAKATPDRPAEREEPPAVQESPSPWSTRAEAGAAGMAAAGREEAGLAWKAFVLSNYHSCVYVRRLP
uniref:Forkhead-associated domain-containing family protein n=1 Tax=Tetraselmis sp. GSL018 TaxID=582737 RepID=A0A061QN52_9CHLO